MKNKNMKQNAFAGMTILAGIGILLLANEIAAQEGQEEIRRSLRGTTLSTPPPPGVDPTGPDPLDPTRAEGGRPSEILVPGGGLEEEVPNTDVNELTMPGADPFLEEVEGPENGEKVYTAPNGKPFPAHWGAPPAIQTRDLRPLPGGYGMGSGTLAGWIQENLDKDAGNPGGGQVGAQAGEVCQVVLYGTVWCGYCTKTRDLFKAQGVSFLDKDIEKDAGARGEMESKMTKAGLKVTGSVPVIDFCGRIMVGYNEGLLLDLIKSQGKK